MCVVDLKGSMPWAGSLLGLDGEHVATLQKRRGKHHLADSGGQLDVTSWSQVGMITFGLSAPIKKVQAELGMTVEAVMAAARPGVLFNSGLVQRRFEWLFWVAELQSFLRFKCQLYWVYCSSVLSPLRARRVMSGNPRKISSRAQVLKSWKKRKLSVWLHWVAHEPIKLSSCKTSMFLHTVGFQKILYIYI